MTHFCTENNYSVKSAYSLKREFSYHNKGHIRKVIIHISNENTNLNFGAICENCFRKFSFAVKIATISPMEG